MEEILHQAEHVENEYDWLAAVASYERALNLLSENDLSSEGRIRERLAHAHYRAAFQADSSGDFQEMLRQSVAEYEKAAGMLFQISPARAAYCRAMAKYSDYWLSEDAFQKKKLLDDCWSLMKETLDGFAAAGDGRGYGKAFLDLVFCLWDRLFFAENLREIMDIVEAAFRCGQTAVTNLSKGSSTRELAWVSTVTSFFMLTSANAPGIPNLDYFEERRTEILSSISEYLKMAVDLRDGIEDVYFQFFLDRTLYADEINVKGDLQTASKWGHNLLPHAEKTKDHYLLALAYSVLSDVANSETVTEEDPDKSIEQLNLAIRSAEQHIRLSLLIRRFDWVAWGYSYWLVESYLRLAELETSVEEKRTVLKRAVEVGREGKEYAQLSGSPVLTRETCHVLSKSLYFLSKTELNAVERRKLLGEALRLRKGAIEIIGRLEPPCSWPSGVAQNYLARIKMDLADIEESAEQKRLLLEDASSSMEICIATCTRHVEAIGVKPLQWFFGALGWYHDWFGEILDRLYALTKDEKIIMRAIEISQGAARAYQKAKMPSRVAEALWRTARLHDQLGLHVQAADDFESASRDYQLVAESIPQLQEFYRDHALYMQAWSEIENARYRHERQEYGLAMEHFGKAAEHHKQLKRWSYLEPNYSAWAQVELAEDLSRKEQSEEALKTFEQASKLFGDTKKSIQDWLIKIEDRDEKYMASQVSKATDTRREYCEARIDIEEARILDKKGDHSASSEKYCSAAVMLHKLSQKAESEQEKKEFDLIITLSQAWAKMTRAEAEGSPDLYAEASKLFEEAKEFGPNEQAKMLTLGHSRFCRALEAGTKFADTRDTTMYTAATHHLESAATYYVKADFPKASEYAKATGLLFDAYAHIDAAKQEQNSEKKAKLYIAAEKILHVSANSYAKAEHPEKREQTLRLLERVREERELAVSITEVLHTPSIISATTSFAAPTPTSEEAVGSERFENADIQASVIASQKNLKVGESLDLEILLVNAGKGPGLLIKLADVIPDGFELIEKPEIYRVEDSFLNLKGRRLDPLETEEVRLVLRPNAQGVFPLKPRVDYLDENGKYKSCEPEPVTVTVKELGIRGWLKGER